MYIYIYVYLSIVLYKELCWLQCVGQSREGRCGKGIEQESSHRQSGQSTLITWPRIQSIHSTQWYTHTHASTHAHTHMGQRRSKSYHQLCNSWLEWIRRDVSLEVTSKCDDASVSQGHCDKESSRMCLLLQSHFQYVNNSAVPQISSNCEKLPIQHKLQYMWIGVLAETLCDMLCTVGTARNHLTILGETPAWNWLTRIESGMSVMLNYQNC